MGGPLTPAERIRRLPPYLFAEIDRAKREVAAQGVDIISLGIGDPDSPTPRHIVEALARAAEARENQCYPDYQGIPAFRQAAAQFCQQRFGLNLDPETQVLSLIGSKEGIANTALAFVDPGDIVLVPDPGYPVYATGALLSGGTPYYMPLRSANGFLPDLSELPDQVAKKAKLLWLNYPNNPTGAVASSEFFSEVVHFAAARDIVVCHDAAYSEIYYDSPPCSILQVPGSENVALEFHSLSKTYNMTGWRVGFLIGNAELVGAVGKVKTNIDSGVFMAVQRAAIAALTDDQAPVAALRQLYRERRDIVVEALEEIGLKPEPCPATFYIWARVPSGYTSQSLATKILREVGVVVTPGNGFGSNGEGFVRLSFTVDTARLQEAVARLKTLRF